MQRPQHLSSNAVCPLKNLLDHVQLKTKALLVATQTPPISFCCYLNVRLYKPTLPAFWRRAQHSRNNPVGSTSLKCRLGYTCVEQSGSSKSTTVPLNVALKGASILDRTLLKITNSHIRKTCNVFWCQQKVFSRCRGHFHACAFSITTLGERLQSAYI